MALATPSTVRPAERTKRSGSAPSPVASAVMSAARNTATADTARSRARARPRSPVMDAVEVLGVARRLEAGGGYQVVHASPGLEIGVYVLVAPEPDRQQPHELDEVYVVLEGSGVLEIDGRPVPVEEGQAAFVPTGVEHRFTAYEQLAVLVVFNGPHSNL